MPARSSLIYLLICLFAVSQLTAQITLRGKNGNEIEAEGVLSANYSGLFLKLPPFDEPMLVLWNKFDMRHLQENHEDIYYAYLDSQKTGDTQLLRIGAYENLVSFEEAIARLYEMFEKPRYYALPPDIDYIFETDPDIVRYKDRDPQRYTREMRRLRTDLAGFLRLIYPQEYVTIDEQGVIHYKVRDTVSAERAGETSIKRVFTILSDTNRAQSRTGLDYLREVSHFREDLYREIDFLLANTPNYAFDNENIDHMKLPLILAETKDAVDHFLESKTLSRGQQYKLGEFYNFVYGKAELYGLIAEEINGPAVMPNDFPDVDYGPSF